jgi:energy-coupling factor transporter ATP-binding protein EcfA2
MRLHSIQIRNVRCVDDELIDVSGRSLFLLGHNGTGKSTVLECVRLALFGRCAWTDARGKVPHPDRVHGQQGEWSEVFTEWRRGNDNLRGEARIEGGKVKWSMVDLGTGEIWESPAKFWGDNMERAYMAATLTGSSLGLLSGLLCEQSETLFGLDAVEREWPGVRGLADRAQSLGFIMDRLQDRQGWERLGLTAYNRRRDVKKEAKANAAVLGDYGDFAGSIEAAEQAEQAARAKVDEQRRVVSGLNQALGELRAHEGEPSPGELRDRLTEAEAALESAIAEANAAECARQEAESELADAKAKAAAAAADAARERKQLDALSADCPECPTCGRAWSKAAREKLLNATTASVGILNVAEQQARELLEYCADQVRAAAGDSSESERAAAAAHAAVVELRKALERATAPEVRHGEGEALIADLERAEAELGRLDAACRAAHDRVTRWAECGRLRAAIDEARRIEAELDALVDAFYHGQILDKVAAHAETPALVRLANEALPDGYVIEAAGPALTLCAPGGTPIPVEAASSGELWRVAAGLAYALARETGAPLIIDNADALDYSGRLHLQEMLGDDSVQTIAAAAWSNPQPYNPDTMAARFPGVTVRWMENQACLI